MIINSILLMQYFGGEPLGHSWHRFGVTHGWMQKDHAPGNAGEPGPNPGFTHAKLQYSPLSYPLGFEAEFKCNLLNHTHKKTKTKKIKIKSEFYLNIILIFP